MATTCFSGARTTRPSAVIPIPDDVIGNRIKAVVAARDSSLTEGELARFCFTLLPKYMVPELYEFLPVLPKTSTGNVDRTALSSSPVQA